MVLDASGNLYVADMTNGNCQCGPFPPSSYALGPACRLICCTEPASIANSIFLPREDTEARRWIQPAREPLPVRGALFPVAQTGLPKANLARLPGAHWPPKVTGQLFVLRPVPSSRRNFWVGDQTLATLLIDLGEFFCEYGKRPRILSTCRSFSRPTSLHDPCPARSDYNPCLLRPSSARGSRRSPRFWSFPWLHLSPADSD